MVDNRIGADEQRLVMGRSKVKPGIMRVEMLRGGGIEAEPARIQPISHRIIVRLVLLCGPEQSSQRRRVDARSGIDLLVLRQVQRVDRGGGARRVHAIGVPDGALAKIGQRNHTGDRRGCCFAHALNAVKEKCLVFDDGAAQRSAKGVADQRRNRHTVLVVEPVIGSEQRAAVKLEERAMPVVGAGLADQVDLGCGAAALVRIGIDRFNTKLRDGLCIQSQHVPAEGVRFCVVNIDAVQRNVGLVAARAGNVAFFRHGRLQCEQVLHVAVVQGQFENLLVLDVVAQGCVLGINLNLAHRGINQYGLLDLADLQGLRYLSGVADQSMDTLHHILSETRCLDLHFIVARRYQSERVASVGLGGLLPREIGLQVRNGYGGAPNRGPRRIGDCASDG